MGCFGQMSGFNADSRELITKHVISYPITLILITHLDFFGELVTEEWSSNWLTTLLFSFFTFFFFLFAGATFFTRAGRDDSLAEACCFLKFSLACCFFVVFVAPSLNRL